MKREYSYHIWPKKLDFSKKLALLPTFASERQMVEYGYQRHYITFSRFENATTNNFNEFLLAISKNSNFLTFSVEIGFKSENADKKINFTIVFSRGCISVAVDASDDDLGIVAHSFIRDEFGLSNPTISEADRDRAKFLQATIFLGRHFDDESKSASDKLRDFLNLIGFKVSEADEYRAEAIPEKVKTLIDQQDIYIGLVIGNREHNWLVAESAYARGAGKHIIMIVEGGSNFHSSIHGKDYEQIVVKPGIVEQCYVKLLQEFRSVGVKGL